MELSKATRKRRGSSRYYLFYVGSLLLVAGLGYGLWIALTNVSFFAVKHISISGNTAIPDSLVYKATSSYMGMNLLSVPSGKVKESLQRFSRVKSVKIRKRLLNTLHLELTERRGMLYVKSFEGNLYPVDAEAIVLAQYTPVHTEDLPIFSTYFTDAQLKAGTHLKKPSLNRILALHTRIATEAPDFLPFVSEYYMIDKTIYIVDAKHGTRIIPSDDDFAQQLKRYLFVQDNGNINRQGVVDLRFKNQVVVKAGNQ